MLLVLCLGTRNTKHQMIESRRNAKGKTSSQAYLSSWGRRSRCISQQACGEGCLEAGPLLKLPLEAPVNVEHHGEALKGTLPWLALPHPRLAWVARWGAGKRL